MTAVIRVRGLTRAYEMGTERILALRGVTLDIARNEYLAIMGPSGSGKSTMMNLLGCLDTPTAGEYWLNGEEVSRLSDDALARVRNREIGFVFQTFNLLPTLTAQENVEAALVPLKVRAGRRRRRAADALAAVGLADRAGHLPHELSGGQQQRVAIARAMVKEPRVLLADEPTGNLDEEMAADIMDLIEERWREQGLTVVLITHDSAVARRARRLGVMRDGKLSFQRVAT
jgi:putative ABC transport system ATP-binding protein